MFGSLRLRRFALAFAMLLACTPVWAQQTHLVKGIVVNFGCVPAEVAIHAAGHGEAHPQHPPPGAQHLLITLDDRKTGTRIGDANVTIEVTGPRGYDEKKPLLHTQAGGLADYSELFRFGASGRYDVRVFITPTPADTPIETLFVVNHTV